MLENPKPPVAPVQPVTDDYFGISTSLQDC
ncbi:hypothetical protein NUACC26_010850 [Scytonema sp. NUACC26]